MTVRFTKDCLCSLAWNGEGACVAEREKGWPGGDDSGSFVLHATAVKARSPPDRDHKSRAGDAVPTAYTIPDDKLTVIHPAQHFLSPRSRAQRPSLLLHSPSLPPPCPPLLTSFPSSFPEVSLLPSFSWFPVSSPSTPDSYFFWPPAHKVASSLGEFLLCVFSPTLLISLPVSVPCESPWPLPTFISCYLFLIFFSFFLAPSSHPLLSPPSPHFIPSGSSTRLRKIITSTLQIPLSEKQKRKRTSSPGPGTLARQPH